MKRLTLVKLTLVTVLLAGVSAGTIAQEAEPAETSVAPEAGEPGEPVALENVELLILDPADQRAVLRVGEGPLVVVKPEGAIEGTRAVVESVAGDKLVVAYTTAEEPPSRFTAWIFQDRAGKSTSRVQYLDPRAPRRAPVDPAARDRTDSRGCPRTHRPHPAASALSAVGGTAGRSPPTLRAEPFVAPFDAEKRTEEPFCRVAGEGSCRRERFRGSRFGAKGRASRCVRRDRQAVDEKAFFGPFCIAP